VPLAREQLLGRRLFRPKLSTQFLAQPVSPAIRARLIRQHAPGYPVQPQRRLAAIREVIKSPPGDQENLSHRVVSIRD
jgi:hypothetical protein